MEREGDFIASIYYGRISSRATERLLERFGRDGSFLLRDSETLPGAYCLCVRRAPFVHTYRLMHSSDGWFLQGPSRRKFPKLQTLLENYRTGHSTESPTVPLIDPLDKTQLPYLSFGPEYLEM
ncbi:SH2 domain-containing protein 1A-like [Eucyclogobius newberryi]|uniref:SH2 domain-containing protein 1A-like n=1 Tax=Eucyclogobius newberryi TaxID=166745 RepID=UPI003B5A8326